jgi:hypothetical protein
MWSLSHFSSQTPYAGRGEAVGSAALQQLPELPGMSQPGI